MKLQSKNTFGRIFATDTRFLGSSYPTMAHSFLTRELDSGVSKTIQKIFVVIAHPQANGQVEVTNWTLSEGIKKRLEHNKGKWVEELDTILWAYRTSSHMAIGETGKI